MTYILELKSASKQAITEINKFLEKTFKTKGGRVGSGLGLVLECLWGFYTNNQLKTSELGWLGEHQYNDFVLTKKGPKPDEILKIEVKSMIKSADEPKAHFDALVKEIGDNDLILVLVWDWFSDPKTGLNHPQIVSVFLEKAKELAKFRDALHLLRGGTFVDSKCPDGCKEQCPHLGEPLNANGKRERKSGPISTKVSDKTSHAANFGGLKRMIAKPDRVTIEVYKTFIEKHDPTGIGQNYIKFINAI